MEQPVLNPEGGVSIAQASGDASHGEASTLLSEAAYDDGVTPSKVRRLSGDPLESPQDILSAREVRNKAQVRKSIKFEFTKAKEDVAGHIEVEEPSVGKNFTSQDSFEVERVSHTEVAKFFLCKVCGKFPVAVLLHA